MDPNNVESGICIQIEIKGSRNGSSQSSKRDKEDGGSRSTYSVICSGRQSRHWHFVSVTLAREFYSLC